MNEAQATLEMLFEKQYILTFTEEVEVRYRTETRTGSYTVTDPETGETTTETYEYEVEVPYNYYILNVDLENFNLSHVPVYIMGEDTLSMYAVYMSALGNRPDLFPQSEYIRKYITDPPEEYEVPAELINSLRGLSRKRKSICIIRMCGAAAIPERLLIAAALCLGC